MEELMGEIGIGIEAIARKQICTMCGYFGEAKTERWGSLLGEAFMWGCVFVTFVLGFVTLFMWFFTVLTFVFALYYSIKRFGDGVKNVCPKCKHSAMIPTDSPKAQEMLKNKNKL